MTARFSKIMLAALLLLFGAQTAAEDAANPGVVPVSQEPRHRLVLDDEYMRLFDVHIPPGDTTLYHSHERDSIYIPISGFEGLVNQEHGKAGKPLVIKAGNVGFAEHSKTPFTHRVSNLGAEEFHVIDIELIAPSKDSLPSEALPVGYQLVLENPRVRISRIVLEPEQFIAGGSTPAYYGLIVVLAGTRIGFRKDSGATQTSDVAPGQFYSRATLVSQEIRNEGRDRLELISVEIK